MKIFLVEDDLFFGESIKYFLSLNPDYEIYLYSNAKDCLNNINLNPDVVCIDFGLPDMSGDLLFKKLKDKNPNLPILIISGQEDIEIAVNFIKNGAVDYIVKGLHSKDLLWNSLTKLNKNIELNQKISNLEEKLSEITNYEKSIIGQSEAIKNVFLKISKSVKTNINVYISGETGTGKELVARAIHFNSNRNNKPFVEVNMAAIPKELMESEFFGHEKGSFTGANFTHIGKFEQANGGTLFLDEIGEMDLNIQSKLLRVLQEREIIKVGGTKKIPLDIRLVVATHKNLADEMKAGRFREDLYYRIMGMPIELPPLRERGQDIILLSNHFINQFCKENKLKTINLSKEAKEALLKYYFPGNVRELKSIIDLACVMCENNIIDENDLTFNNLKFEDLMFEHSNKTLKEFNNDIILYYLKKNNNDVLKTSEQLDIGKSTIYNLLKKIN